MTLEYERGVCRTTRLVQRRTPEGVLVEIAAAEGAYPGAPAQRDLSLVIWGFPRAPAAVLRDDQALEEGEQWEHDGESNSVLIYLGRVPAGVAQTVRVTRGTED